MKYENYLLPPHPKWLYLIAVPFLILGVLLIATGVLFSVGGSLLIIRRENFFVGALMGVLGILSITGGKIIFIFGRRFLAIKSEHRLIQNFQPRILYLRSFKSENKTKRILTIGREINIGLLRLPDITATTEEQILSGIFQKVGTPVAVGHPKEKLPLLGIPRIYLDDNWKEVVKGLISDVEWVFIRADDSEGLWSEIEFAFPLVNPTRLVLIIPFADDRENFEIFRRKLEGLIKKTIPYVYGTKVKGIDLTGLIYFDHEGKPEIVNILQPYDPFNPNKDYSIKEILESAFRSIPNFEVDNINNKRDSIKQRRAKYFKN